MAPKIFALLVGFALLAGACGEGGHVTPTPAPDEPMFSAGAAIGLVSNTCRNPRIASLIRSDGEAVYRGNGTWSVKCLSIDWGLARWEVNEATGMVAPVGDHPWHIICQREPSE